MRAIVIALAALLSTGAALADETKSEPGQGKQVEAKATKRNAPLAIGDAAPMTDVKMENVDGKQLSIADVKGEKGTLVIFSCNHCPVAKAYEGRIAAIGNEWKKNGFGVIVVNSNDPKAAASDGMDGMKERAKERGFEFPYVVDATSDLARAFGASKTPEVFLFDKDLKLAYYGSIDSDQNDEKGAEPYLAKALGAMSEGKPIATPKTKAFGCGIKFRAETKAEEKTSG